MTFFRTWNLFALCAAVVVKVSLAATVTYNWDITWVLANPDGRLVRPVIGINNQWPCPTLRANVGDTVIVNVVNQLGNETTSIHYHGLYQNGTTEMDGPAEVSQCLIPPGGSFTYEFTINQPGTYWYHSHAPAQYPDGLRGPLIIDDPNSPYAGHYDEELVLTLSDWYHDQMPGLFNTYLSAAKNPSGAEPVPYSALFNDNQNIQFAFTPGKTYFVRIISMAAFAATYVSFDEHEMTIIETDGIYTQPTTASQIYVTAAQRYGVLITAKPTANKNYAFIGSQDLTMFNYIPSYLNPNVTGYLVYNQRAPLPPPLELTTFDPIDDFTIEPYDKEPLFPKPDKTVTLAFEFTTIQGQNRAIFNNVTYLPQKVPSLYTALSTGVHATDPRVYGVNANAFVLSPGTSVEIVLNNFDNGGHPFHLHGHAFQVVARSEVNAGTYPGDNAVALAPIPVRRDVVMVQAGGYVVLRFIANNPGVWFFHCHIEWHLESGLATTFIESPLLIQQNIKVPSQHYATCKADGQPYQGNAAGNTMNVYDLNGANVNPPQDFMGALVG